MNIEDVGELFEALNVAGMRLGFCYCFACPVLEFGDLYEAFGGLLHGSVYAGVWDGSA